jgi:glycine/D-amino acid oxidase-like deaminating enzyme
LAAGIYGAQVAYHLAKNGRKDVVIIEKGEIASGESSHAAGLVTQFATSQAMLRFRMYSVQLYKELGLFDMWVVCVWLRARNNCLKWNAASAVPRRWVWIVKSSHLKNQKAMPQISDKDLIRRYLSAR